MAQYFFSNIGLLNRKTFYLWWSFLATNTTTIPLPPGRTTTTITNIIYFTLPKVELGFIVGNDFPNTIVRNQNHMLSWLIWATQNLKKEPKSTRGVESKLMKSIVRNLDVELVQVFSMQTNLLLK